MRTEGGLHAAMLQRDNLVAAAHQAARGRRGRPEVMAYMERLDDELWELRGRLESGDLGCGECHTFTIHDPKERMITAPVFRERVLHHAVMNVCGPVLERRLVFHSYACRKGKGTFAALEEACRAAGRAAWFLKLDVRKYFDSIPHGRLVDALGRVFREVRVVGMLTDLVRAYRPGTDRGLAIGTLVSQHLANFYLSPIDRAVVQGMARASRGYVRYMDDMAVWMDSAEACLDARDALLALGRSGLDLGFKTSFVNRTSRGMDFLGHRVHPHWMGLSRATRRRHGRAMRRLHDAWASGAISEPEAQVRGTAMVGFIRHARCDAWRGRLLRDMQEPLEDGPQAGAARSGAGAGSTTAGTPPPAIATATIPATGTTTSVSGPAPAPPDGGSQRMEQARPPAPAPGGPDKTKSPGHRPVTPATDVPQAKADAWGDLFNWRNHP